MPRQELREQVLERLWDATVFVDTFEVGDADRIATAIVDAVIANLKRDPRWATVTRAQWELTLADVRRRLEQDLYAELDGYAPASDLLAGAADAVIELLAEQAHAPADETDD